MTEKGRGREIVGAVVRGWLDTEEQTRPFDRVFATGFFGLLAVLTTITGFSSGRPLAGLCSGVCLGGAAACFWRGLYRRLSIRQPGEPAAPYLRTMGLVAGGLALVVLGAASFRFLP
jgi:hypothetical protein